MKTINDIRKAVIAVSEDAWAPLVQTYGECGNDFKNFTDADIKDVCVGDSNELALMMGWVLTRKRLTDVPEEIKDMVSRYFCYGVVCAPEAVLMANSDLCDVDENSEGYDKLLISKIQDRLGDLCSLLGAEDFGEHREYCTEHREELAPVMGDLFYNGFVCAIHQHDAREIADAVARHIKED